MSSHAKYTILRKIADGGMAEIFLAQTHGAQGFLKLVVLKRIRRAFSTDAQFKRMLVGEAHVAMQLNHSNIVQILDLGEAGDRYFLVLELVDGWSLDQLLKRAQAQNLNFPRELAVYVTLQMARALAYAHAKRVAGQPLGIVHRDVSPQNVLLSEHGEVKLTDFGIAKARNRSERTEKGVVKGKIAFMSPEQAVGGTLDGRSDIYSLGTILYLMVTGRHPFQGATDLETMVRVQSGEFISPAKLRPKVDGELTRVILKAMAREPASRYPTAEAFLADLEELLRTTFQPAGQTELTRWLEKLRDADAAVPISQLPSAPGEAPPETMELSDSDILPVSSTTGKPTSPDIFAEVPEGTGPAPALAPLPPPSLLKRESSRSTTLFVGLAVVFTLSAIALSAVLIGRMKPAAAITPASTTPVASVLDAGPALISVAPAGSLPSGVFTLVDAGALASPAAAAPPPDAGGALSSGATVATVAAVGEAPSGADAGVGAAEAPVTAAAGPFAPDAGTAMASEDASGAGASRSVDKPEAADAGTASAHAEASASNTAAVHASEDTARPRSADAPARLSRSHGSERGHGGGYASFPPAGKEGMVSILLSSVPEGASVHFQQRTFGRTPIHIRFTPGLDFDVTFTLPGYEATTRHFTAKDRAGQHVTAYLQRR